MGFQGVGADPHEDLQVPVKSPKAVDVREHAVIVDLRHHLTLVAHDELIEVPGRHQRRIAYSEPLM